MKQCPNCKTNYTDDSMQFCLSDGASLFSVSNDVNTVQMSFGRPEPMRFDIAPDSAPTVFAQPAISQNQPSKKGIGLIVAGLLGVLLFLVVGLIAAYLLLRPTVNQPVVIAASPTVSSTATPNDETARLREEMANLKKQMENQKTQKQNPTVEFVSPPVNSGRTARANSPGDGFLALRSEPNSETGQRLAKIPHGAALTVIACPKPSNVGKRSGRWCQVIYNGQSGWAFDGFISF